MSTATAPLEAPTLPSRAIAGVWGRHLLSLYLPVNSLLFLWTGPHSWYIAFAFLAPLFVAHQIDCSQRTVRDQPLESLPAWPFDALVYLLAALQFLVVAEVIRLFSVQGFFSFDMLMIVLIVGGSSGFSIITAHELIHRRKTWEQGLGRLLLCSVLYEHFYTEHLRGHHVRVGTLEDPATARFGEPYEPFFRRTVPAQLKSAWKLEKRRLGDPEMGVFDRRMWQNRILHGLLIEWGFAFAILAAFGLIPFLAFVIQAFMAIRLLEAVNYFEHWGLVRSTRRVRPVDSWDTHAWFTYYGLVGLSRHADHHETPSRPYQELRVLYEAPILPFGYIGMVDLVMGRNEDFQRMAAEELGRRRLGPFARDSEADQPAVEVDAALAQLALARGETDVPTTEERRGAKPTWRRFAIAAGLILVTALGVQWETAGTQMGLATRLFAHTWIVALFIGVFGIRARIAGRVGENPSWALAISSLVGLGWLGGLIF